MGNIPVFSSSKALEEIDTAVKGNNAINSGTLHQPLFLGLATLVFFMVLIFDGKSEIVQR